MIYVTGDTHGPIDQFKTEVFCVQHNVTSNDYLIICGDFGGVWFGNDNAFDIATRNYYKDQPWTILFVDGNHENFDLLNSYPVTEWHGGKIHQIDGQIIHLMRGQIYEIDGHSFFTMGGARSTDQHNRTEGISWWSQEMPSDQEYEEALNNLTRYNNNVDYILSHCAPDSIHDAIGHGYYIHDKLTNFLEVVRQTVTFNHWYFGHYHQDNDWNNKYSCLYNRIIELD